MASAAAVTPVTAPHDDAVSPRYDRPALVGFVGDARTEEALRDALFDAVGEELDLRRGGIRAAITAMQKQMTPRTLVIDVSGEEQPLTALGELSHVVEPDVRVLLVGEITNVDFYREVTRGLGVAEYLTKPLSRDIVARHFLPLVEGSRHNNAATPGRRGIAITGVRGGAGATTIAVNLAYHLGVSMRRHTVLLDPDVQFGTASLLLNTQGGPGLRMALEAPDRIDAVLAERAAIAAGDRLHLLCSEEHVESPFNPTLKAAALMSALRRRYNFIVADVPPAPIPLYRELLNIVDQRVFVMPPTLPAVRDTLRLLSLPAGAGQTDKPLIILNRNGLTGGLNRREVEEALKTKVDIVIPDLPRHVGGAATMGEPAIMSSSALRAAIVELARQVAFSGLLDSADAGQAGTPSAKRGRWSFLFGKR